MPEEEKQVRGRASKIKKRDVEVAYIEFHKNILGHPLFNFIIVKIKFEREKLRNDFLKRLLKKSKEHNLQLSEASDPFFTEISIGIEINLSCQNIPDLTPFQFILIGVTRIFHFFTSHFTDYWIVVFHFQFLTIFLLPECGVVILTLFVAT